MPFTIPNAADATFPPQAQVDKVDLDIIVAGSRNNGVVSGCAVTTTGAANGSVSVAAGVIRYNDALYTASAATVAITANASGNPRFDLITVPTTGTPVRTGGTAATSPVTPNVPATSVALYTVYVPNGHTGTTIIPANTLVDKRMDVPGVLASATDGTAHYQITAPNDDKPILRIKGAVPGTGDPGVQSLQALEIVDYNGAPIWWVNGTGGVSVNDFMRTSYTVFGPDPFVADIYGFVWRGKQCSFVFGGPPGNMLSWTDACHEVFQYNRAASLGNWSVGGATLATTDLGNPPSSPTGYRTALRITNNSGGTATIAQPGGVFALPGVVAGQYVSGAAWLRSGTAAAARNATVRLTFWTNLGAQVGANVDSAAVSIPNTGVWTAVPLNGALVPATATRVQISILVASLNTETHDVCGVGIMKGQKLGVFGPPFVAQTSGGGPANVEGIALKGDGWRRTDLPGVPGSREYICAVGGSPYDQIWNPIDASDVLRLGTDVPNATISMVNVSELDYAVQPNTAYMFAYTINVTASSPATGGVQWGFTGPASPTSVLIYIENQVTVTTTAITQLTAFGNMAAASASGLTGGALARITMMLFNGPNAGTVGLRFASETAGTTVTVKAGAILQVT